MVRHDSARRRAKRRRAAADIAKPPEPKVGPFLSGRAQDFLCTVRNYQQGRKTRTNLRLLETVGGRTSGDRGIVLGPAQ